MSPSSSSPPLDFRGFDPSLSLSTNDASGIGFFVRDLDLVECIELPSSSPFSPSIVLLDLRILNFGRVERNASPSEPSISSLVLERLPAPGSDLLRVEWVVPPSRPSSVSETCL